MVSGSVLTFRFFGCAVTVSPLFTGWLTLLLLVDTTGMMSRLLPAVALHEAGHLLFLAWFDCLPRQITLSLFEVNMVMGTRSLARREQLLVSAGGVLANGLAALAFAGGFRRANLYLAAFNLLPLFSMDGYQMIEELCRPWPRLRALAPVLSLVTVAVLAGIGIWLLVTARKPMLLLFCLYMATLQIRRQRHSCNISPNGVS